MASLIPEKANGKPTGKWTLQFMDITGVRRSVRLGAASEAKALAMKARIETLCAEAMDNGGAVSDETAKRVLGKLYIKLADKLVKGGLVRGADTTALGPFLDQYVAGRTDAEPSTISAFGQVVRNLVDHFGRDRRLATITEADSDAFRLALLGDGLAKSTAAKRTKTAKMFLKAACRAQLIPANPFDHIKCPNIANPDRRFFITRETTDKMLGQCPSPEWRLMVSLARYGGFRCPSETLGLKWGDVAWGDGPGKGRITIHSPKTKRYAGRASRQIPLFPELVEPLRSVSKQAEEGEVYVISRERAPAATLRKRLLRIITRAGLVVWPRIWQNMRASRETELIAEGHPLHVVVAWLGNSTGVAMAHYLQVVDADFERGCMHQGRHQEVTQGRKMPPPPVDRDPLRADETACDGMLQEVGVSRGLARLTQESVYVPIDHSAHHRARLELPRSADSCGG